MTLQKFQKLLKENPDAEISNFQSTKKWRTHRIEDLPFHLFVDLEIYFEQSDYYNFCNIFVKKYFWQTIKVQNLYTIIEDYGKQKQELKEKFVFVYDPPIFGEQTPDTIGSELRKDFVQDFGIYVILMDLVCKDKTRYKEVEKWKTQEFLFWANYLTGQKIIENVK